MGYALKFERDFDEMSCGDCGVVFWIPAEMKRNLLEHKNDWYCPNGHCRHFIGKSHAEKAQEEAERQRRRAAELQETVWKQERALKRLKTRAKHGICPCCNRSFKQLAAHMKRKHPEWPDA